MTLLRGCAVGALTAALLSTACGRGAKTEIAVIPMGNSHLYWQSVHAGAVKAARELRVEVLWNGPPSETDFTGQLKIVDAMINRRVSAIAVAPIDRQALVSVVERASRAKIPVVIFDSPIDTQAFVAQIATDNYHAGEMAAERMGLILHGQGNVGIVGAQPGSASSTARERGFEDTIRKNFPGIRIVEKQFGMADFALSLAKAENILTGHPDLEGMFASNESSSVGTAQALRERRSQIKMVGFDWSPTLLNDVQSGLIDSLIVQNPFRMGYDSVKAAVTALRGGTVTRIQNLPPRLVTQQNLHDPDVKAQLHPDLKKYLD
ncbi:MAG: substrate-binding domain-containing protein [Bryobacteraceae bacterium]